MAAGVRLPPLPSIREIIRLYRLRAVKQLSQNFLLDQNISRKIVRAAAGNLRDAVVCEVGPGPGGITRAILEAGVKQLSVVEKDSRFLPSLELLNEASNGIMRLYHDDILKFNLEKVFPEELTTDWSNPPPNLHIIGNLPFNVSTPLIIQWLRDISNKSSAWSRGRVQLTLTFQKEVAERMVAPVMKTGRCRLSLMCQNWCHVDHRFTVPGKVFVPVPDVDVGVVRFTPRIEPTINLPFTLVEKVLRHVFHFRQKMCKRGLQTLFPPDSPHLTRQICEMSDIHPDSKSFSLSVDDFNRICHSYKQICDENVGLFEYDYRSSENARKWRKCLEPLDI